MSHNDTVDLVQGWQAAVNAQDVDRVIMLSAPDIEMIGPRGSAYGTAILRDWVRHAGIRLTTQRVFAHGDVVVVAQHGAWRSTNAEKVIGEANVASCFRVANNLVVQVARYDNVDLALEAGGLKYTDEVLHS